MRPRIILFVFIAILLFTLSAVSADQFSDFAYKGLPQSVEASSIDYHSFGSSTPPATEWNRTYGPSTIYSSTQVVQADDGGFVLAGYGTSEGGFGAGGHDFSLVKTDVVGRMQWNRTYGGTGADLAQCVQQTSDGGYIITGYTDSFRTYTRKFDFWLVKTDSSGVHQWNKTYGGSDNDSGWFVVQTSDGGYAIAGRTHSFGAGSADFWLVKTDATGNLVWSKAYGGNKLDTAWCVQQTNDGGYIIAGRTDSFGAGLSDIWLVKTDAGGNMQWNKTYGGADRETATSVIQTSDEGYVIVGLTNSSSTNPDLYMVKTDSNGNLDWSKTYGGSEHDVAYSIAQTDDQGYIIVGDTRSFGAGSNDIWLIKTDQVGDMQWSQIYGKAYQDSGRSVVQTSDGGYALTGYTQQPDGEALAWLIKVASEGADDTIFIRPDGTLDPMAAPISTVDNITYTLTGNVTSNRFGIVVERDNIVLDGADYAIQGTENGIGIYLEHRDNITIKNIETKGFYYGIYLWQSSNNTIYGNSISANTVYGLYIRNSSDNNISKNNVTTNHDHGIWLDESTNNVISENNIIANYGDGIVLTNSTSNIVLENNIADNLIGMSTDKSSSNKFYHNNFINNTSQANATSNCVDIWDDGFTSGGNYWSDYAGEDAYSGIFQNETCRDGIGDTAYLIDEDNSDCYPLVDSWSTHLNPPVARFAYIPTLPSARQGVTFNASSSYDLDEDIVVYHWNFGDDNTTSSADSNITHVYSLPGIYNATLAVIDSRDLNSSYSKTIWVRMITFVSITTSSRSTFVGYEVNVTGTLHDMFGNGLNNETVVLHYTFGGISTWTPITSDSTDNLGNYHAVWIPPATGSFLIKAEWVGNLTYVGAHNITYLDTLSYVDEFVFSVESNSTVSSLSFNPNNMKLSFTVSGSLGTQGYVRITFAKSLVDDIEDVKVYLNNEQIDYTATSLDDSWLLHFTYQHSIQEVTISLSDISTPFAETLLGWAIICLVPITVVVALALVYVMKRKRANR